MIQLEYTLCLSGGLQRRLLFEGLEQKFHGKIEKSLVGFIGRSKQERANNYWNLSDEFSKSHQLNLTMCATCGGTAGLGY